MLSTADSETAEGSAFHQWGLTHVNLELCALMQSTWCAGCPGGPEQLWPRPGGHVHCFDQMCDCPQHWKRKSYRRVSFFQQGDKDLWTKMLKSSPVVLFVHQVIASPESHQMGIVSWCWDGNWPGAAHVSVTKLVGKDLQLIWWEVVVVPEHMIVRRPAGSLSEVKMDDDEYSLRV